MKNLKLRWRFKEGALAVYSQHPGEWGWGGRGEEGEEQDKVPQGMEGKVLRKIRRSRSAWVSQTIFRHFSQKYSHAIHKNTYQITLAGDAIRQK